MSQTDSDDRTRAFELSEVYEELEKDAKLLIADLSEGVKMWRAVAVLMVMISLLGFFLLWLALNPAAIRFAAVPIEYVATALFGLSALVGAGVATRNYVRLKKKYRKLFEAARTLS